MWFYFLTFVATTHEWFKAMMDTFSPAFTLRSNMDIFGFCIAILPLLFIAAPIPIMLLGWIYVFMPRTRSGIFERKNYLNETDEIPEMQEIKTFLHSHSEGLSIKSDLLQLSRTSPVIYPVSFTKSAIAIFGGFIGLWNQNCNAAKSMLLHEIGHMKTGDILSLGAGSPFYKIVNFIPIVYLICLTPAILLMSFNFILILVSPIFGLFQIKDVISSLSDIFFLLKSTLEILLGYTYMFSSLVISIWGTELASDHYAVIIEGDTNGINNSLSMKKNQFNLLKRVSNCISHPPLFIRKIFINCDNVKRMVFLFLIFPAMIFFEFLLKLATTQCIYCFNIKTFSFSGCLLELLNQSNKFWTTGDGMRNSIILLIYLVLWPIIKMIIEKLKTAPIEHKGYECEKKNSFL